MFVINELLQNILLLQVISLGNNKHPDIITFFKNQAITKKIKNIFLFLKRKSKRLFKINIIKGIIKINNKVDLL